MNKACMFTTRSWAVAFSGTALNCYAVVNRVKVKCVATKIIGTSQTQLWASIKFNVIWNFLILKQFNF